jgi:polyhydroxybutyrate depolymerase
MAWAVYDRCATAFETLPQTLDIDSGIDGPNGPTETKLEVAEGCPPGGHVELWTIPGGSHVPDLSTSFPTEVIDFLLAHPKP